MVAKMLPLFRQKWTRKICLYSSYNLPDSPSCHTYKPSFMTEATDSVFLQRGHGALVWWPANVIVGSGSTINYPLQTKTWWIQQCVRLSLFSHPQLPLLVLQTIMILKVKGTVQDLLQPPHCSANCLQHTRSYGHHTSMCKPHATHWALSLSHTTCHVPHVVKGQLCNQF